MLKKNKIQIFTEIHSHILNINGGSIEDTKKELNELEKIIKKELGIKDTKNLLENKKTTKNIVNYGEFSGAYLNLIMYERNHKNGIYVSKEEYINTMLEFYYFAKRKIEEYEKLKKD